MSPEWPDCLKLREECQGKIFSKMDTQHAEVMKAIGIIAENVATVKGEKIGEDRALARVHDTDARPAVSRTFGLSRLEIKIAGVALLAILQSAVASLRGGTSKTELAAVVAEAVQTAMKQAPKAVTP